MTDELKRIENSPFFQSTFKMANFKRNAASNGWVEVLVTGDSAVGGEIILLRVENHYALVRYKHYAGTTFKITVNYPTLDAAWSGYTAYRLTGELTS